MGSLNYDVSRLIKHIEDMNYQLTIATETYANDNHERNVCTDISIAVQSAMDHDLANILKCRQRDWFESQSIYISMETKLIEKWNGMVNTAIENMNEYTQPLEKLKRMDPGYFL